MGTIRNGVNGGFRGKAGSVIGSSWKSVDYIKGLYKKRTKPATEEQLMQQARFTTVMRFLIPITPLLRIGYGQRKANTTTGVNMALRANMNVALTGSYPDYGLDYAKLRISEGAYLAGGATTVAVDNGNLDVSWDSMLSTLYDTKADDNVYILLYQPTIDEFLAPATTPKRGDGAVSIEIPAHFLGGDAHVWLFFADRKNVKVSKSSYLGEVTLS